VYAPEQPNGARSGKQTSFLENECAYTDAMFHSNGLTPGPGWSVMAAGLALLYVRGVLLWVVIPLGVVVGIFMSPWLFARHITYGQFLGWIDVNMIVALRRSIFRPFFVTPGQSWIRPRDMAGVKHRIGLLDPY